MLTDEILKDLIEALSGVPLGNRAVSTDILGDAYEYLIGKFADITRRKKAGEFYTPRSVVKSSVRRFSLFPTRAIWSVSASLGSHSGSKSRWQPGG